MADNASVGSRIVAVIIDTIVLWVIIAILAIPLGLGAVMYSGMAGAMDMAAMMGAWASFMFLAAVISIAYFTYLEGSSGQTLGKKLVNIKVVKEKGKMTYVDAFVRTLLRIIDGIAFYLIGFIVIIASEKKQRIGDMAAGTLVVKA
ncbi:MAG: RDD family protein [Candidatus Aenigmarchaeota archaeon]|nr:RDD family protein [Candidatus Aenigmarchaeota archaeon]